uniref:Uncharacterized protein n=1 Tax=Octopus bimaculoides TaxID=37653 RepID=A0A0L8FMP0_OCTBM
MNVIIYTLPIHVCIKCITEYAYKQYPCFILHCIYRGVCVVYIHILLHLCLSIEDSMYIAG